MFRKDKFVDIYEELKTLTTDLKRQGVEYALCGGRFRLQQEIRLLTYQSCQKKEKGLDRITG